MSATLSIILKNLDRLNEARQDGNYLVLGNERTVLLGVRTPMTHVPNRFFVNFETAFEGADEDEVLVWTEEQVAELA